MQKVALFLFNSSEYATQPWQDIGVHCVSVDYNDTDHSNHRLAHESTPLHTRLDLDLSQPQARRAVNLRLANRGMQAAMVISFAPCTDLAVSGAAHFARKRAVDPLFQEKAADMAVLAAEFGVPFCVENPISVLSTLWRKPDMIWHPCDFAGYCPEGPHPEAPDIYPERDRYNKRTCIWTGHGFKLPLCKHLDPSNHTNPGHQKLGGKSARTKHLRSLTPRGFSEAIMRANIGHFTTCPTEVTV
jgi:hypothetical protein